MVNASATPPWWADSYPPGFPVRLTVEATSLVEAWRNQVESNPGRKAIAYFDGSLTVRRLDELSDAFAAALEFRGIRRGDRIGIQMQNIPQYVISFLALWKLGAAAVLLNPMYRGQELRHLIDDSGVRGIIAEDGLYAETSETAKGSSVEWVVTTSGLEYQSRNDPRVFRSTDPVEPSPDGDMERLMREFQGQSPTSLDPHIDDIALLTYTSGTTGPPKGAMNTHGNILNVTATCVAWMGLRPGDSILAVAPLFHITGAVIDAITPLLHGMSLVLINRPHPAVAVEAFSEHRVTCTTGSITIFNAMCQIEGASAEHFASARVIYSGGAPVSPAMVESFRERFGKYIHNIYGMTESTSAAIAVPSGVTAPIDPVSGSLSIGLPMPNIEVRIVDPAGNPVPAGEQGELELSGPQIIPGYWNKPMETATTMPGGRLRTGDVAVMDKGGWVYIVGRLKDQINVSGYKVWPREVEDVLCGHPAVHEAAVVGQPDSYSGETVVAYVSPRAGHTLTEEEMIDFARQRLAAYKYPRVVHVVDELPKTHTGKIRLRALRDPRRDER